MLKSLIMNYCESIYQTRRLKTRPVMVGNVGVGGENPVRIQSMTTSSTRDVEATIEQAVRLADVGCEIVDPFLDLQLVIVQIEREVGHGPPCRMLLISKPSIPASPAAPNHPFEVRQPIKRRGSASELKASEPDRPTHPIG